MVSIRDIIYNQKQQLAVQIQENYISREIIMPSPDAKMIVVVIGPRRSGKSFYLLHYLHQIGSFGYVNFDDEKLVDIENYDDIIQAINELYQNPKNVFFDEIQNLPRWELFVNRIQRQGINVFLSGSNSNLLSSELATHLTGRYLLHTVFPLSFKELCETLPPLSTEAEKRILFEKYLFSGGYPELYSKPIDRDQYIPLLLEATLYKDIARRYKIRYIHVLDAIVNYFLANIASDFSYSNMTHFIQVSVHTIQNYVEFLEGAFLFITLPRFSIKIKEQIRANHKIYCIDNGLISSKGFRFLENKGKYYENCVAIQLNRKKIQHNLALYYWKNTQNEEVDFVVKKGLQILLLIQVSIEIDKTKTRDREIRALLKAGRDLHCERLVIITEKMETTRTEHWQEMKAVVEYIPLWKWLLNERLFEV